MNESEFKKFFIAQFGARSLDKRKDDELAVAIVELEALKNEYYARVGWDDQYRAALYSWNARGNK